MDYKFLPLPPNFCPVYCTVDEACSYARCSRWTGFQRIRQRRWLAFKDGRITKIEFASVVEDMERTKAESRAASVSDKPIEKRSVGRPRSKPRPDEEHPQAPAE